MKYKVHIYAIVRVPVEVEADTPELAIECALENGDLHGLFSGDNSEYHGENDGYLVDSIDADGNAFDSINFDGFGNRS